MRGRTARRPGRTPLDVGVRTEDALAAAYAAHGAELYRFALRQLRDEGAAQEVVQEVFLRAWRRADTFDGTVASLRGWLFAIARNAVVDEVRRIAVRPWRSGLTDDPEFGQAAVASFDTSVLDAWVVEEALRTLRVEHRTAIVEAYLRGRPYAEIAAETGVPVGTVRSRVFYGLKALRLAMDEMGVEP